MIFNTFLHYVAYLLRYREYKHLVLTCSSVSLYHLNTTLLAMSKQKGIVKLVGNLGGISFYTADGQSLARIANGPSKERIAKDPAFKRTRENNKEFGGSARAAKALRLSMGGLMQTMAGTRLVSTLTALFKSINLKGSGARGKRPIEASQHKAMLKNLEFNKKVSFSTVFAAPFTTTNTPDRNEGVIQIGAFLPDSIVNAPSGSTHFRLVTALGVISDYLHDDGTNSYEPIVPDQDSLGATAYSGYLALDSNVPVTTLTATLAGAPVIDAQCTVVQTLGVEFYQEVDGQFYLFAQDNAMKVVNAF